MGGPYPKSGGLGGLAVSLAFALVGVAVGGFANFAADGGAKGWGLVLGFELLVGGVVLRTAAERGLVALVGMLDRCCGTRLREVCAKLLATLEGG